MGWDCSCRMAAKPLRSVDWAHVSTPDTGITGDNAPSYNFISGQLHVWITRSGKKEQQ